MLSGSSFFISASSARFCHVVFSDKSSCVEICIMQALYTNLESESAFFISQVLVCVEDTLSKAPEGTYSSSTTVSHGIY